MPGWALHLEEGERKKLTRPIIALPSWATPRPQPPPGVRGEKKARVPPLTTSAEAETAAGAAPNILATSADGRCPLCSAALHRRRRRGGRCSAHRLCPDNTIEQTGLERHSAQASGRPSFSCLTPLYPLAMPARISGAHCTSAILNESGRKDRVVVPQCPTGVHVAAVTCVRKRACLSV